MVKLMLFITLVISLYSLHQSACSKKSNCGLILIDSDNRCILYTYKAARFLVPDDDIYFYYDTRLSLSYYNRKTLNYDGLIHYWPLNGINDDLVGKAHLTSFGDKSLVLDPFGNTVVYLNKTYYQLPADVYFNGSFSITSWFRIDYLVPHVRLFDCGNGRSSDNIILSLGYYIDLSITFYLFTGSFYRLIESPSYEPGQWYFLAATFDGTIGKIYLNGNIIGQGLLDIPHNVNRTTCYIGASNWAGDQYTDAYIGDFKIYNRCLNQTEVMSELN